MGFKSSHITRLLYSILATLAIAFLLFEWFQLNSKEDSSNAEQVAVTAVEEVFIQLQNRIFEFSSTSTDFANEVSTQIRNSASVTAQNSSDSDFWGVSVYEDGIPIYWNGYTSTEILDSLHAFNSELKLEREREGNVQYLKSIIPFTEIVKDDTVHYQVITRFLLEQENATNIGKSKNKSVIQFENPNQFPVKVSFSRVNSDSIIHSRDFESISGDFIATVYASPSDNEVYSYQRSLVTRTTRGYFILSIVLLFSILIIWITKSLNVYIKLVIQWAFIALIYFLQAPILENFNQSLFTLTIIEVTFIITAYISFFLFLNRRFNEVSSSNLSEKYLLFFINGLGISLLWLYLLTLLQTVVDDSELNLFNQVLTSDLKSTVWLWYLGSVFLVLATLFNSVFLKSLLPKGQLKWSIFFATIVGAFTPLTIGFLLSIELALTQYILWISAIGLGAIFGLSILQITLNVLNYKVSLLRVLLVIMTVVACSFTATIYYSFDDTLSGKVALKSAEFERDNEDQIRIVITELLNEAYRELRSISLFSVSNFEQLIGNLIQDEWLKYSFSLQLIDKTGSPLAAYNTNLSVPQWTTDFRIDELIIPYEEERIRKENVRPILRSQPINTVNAEYSYFMRGWIPVYQSRRSTNISGWILATLYQEIPELNRPFRSVVNATIQSPEEAAFAFTEYQNGVPNRTIVSGALSSIPDYGVLPKSIQTALEQDSIYFQNSTIQTLDLKERFSRSADGSIIRAAYQRISISQILYVFLRIYFTVAVPVILILLVVLGSNFSKSFTESRKIRDRLMDRSIIASIVCLFLLIGATSIILESQNRNEVQESLRDQLKTLTQTIREADTFDQTSNDFLENITAVLGVDASLYSNGNLINTTTPPIYNQHIIPQTISWEIYDQIVNEGAQLAIDILSIDNQELMIGYQPWLDENNQIAGIVAIPTFLNTPDYYGRLLSTTSYLLAFYSLIFSVLIISIGIISARITAPLESLEKGLERISAGDLNSRLKVHANDEIGVLAKSYNSMAARLKTLQEELAQTEREAAWKEMAQQVAHEIKNPLTPMKLNLQHLERQLQQTGDALNMDKPRVSAITKSMIEQIEALNKIASDFSKFAKPSSQKFEEVKINELISSVVMMYNEDQLNISTEFDNREFIISGVPDELRRVLVNLIKNALEAIPEKGKIEIKTQWNKPQKAVNIYINDNGKGISDKEGANIFLPNFSTKTSGTGLGLAITKKIIDEHSGTIQFESIAKKGTSFILTLPLKNSSSQSILG